MKEECLKCDKEATCHPCNKCTAEEKELFCDKCKHSPVIYCAKNTFVRVGSEEPYIESIRAVRVMLYNPNYGDDRMCICGHPYYRHFDTYDDMRACGCKYCPCFEFKEFKQDDLPKCEDCPNKSNICENGKLRATETCLELRYMKYRLDRE